jgi:hypothetical protein
VPTSKTQSQTPRLLNAYERVTFSQELHPGWVRATEILLRGMARLKSAEHQAADTK